MILSLGRVNHRSSAHENGIIGSEPILKWLLLLPVFLSLYRTIIFLENKANVY